MADDKLIEAMARVIIPEAWDEPTPNGPPSYVQETRRFNVMAQAKAIRLATAALAAYRAHQHEAGIVEVDYVPAVLSLPDADLEQIVLADVPAYAAETIWATVLRRIDDRTIIGVQWPAAQEKDG